MGEKNPVSVLYLMVEGSTKTVLLSASVCQINGECSSFQSLDLLKSRPAHLSVFLHHVVSQFDPAPLVNTHTHTIIDST